MATRQYIGARYVPLLDGDWDSTKVYEPLTVVSYNFGSYTSKKPVPAGIVPTNTEYWQLTGNYNAQVEAYRQEVVALKEDIKAYSYDKENVINVLFPPEDTDIALVADGIAAEYTDNTAAFQALIDKYGSEQCYYFPGGAYGFNGAINIPFGQISIVGDGYKYTRFRIHDNSGVAFLTIGNDNSMTPLVTIKDIGFIADEFVNYTSAITIKNPRTCKISNVLFQDFYNDIDISAIYESSGQTSIIEWCTHTTVNRTGMNRLIYFRNSSATIFPNGFYIHHNHGYFGTEGEFVSGFACDIWINNNNIANCIHCVNLAAANQNIGGDVQILGNTFADCCGHVINLSHFNRGILISNNMIEQKASWTTVFAAIRLNDCNGIVITGNCVGTEREAIGINHVIGFVLVDGNIKKDILIEGNVCYLGAYVLNGAGIEFLKVLNNILHKVGNNTTSQNAFYINNISKAIITGNTLDYDIVNSAYTTTHTYAKENLYRGTINAPFEAADNYLYS